MPSSFPVYDSVLQPDETGQVENILDEGESDASTFELCSQQSSSSNTASNLPGSGRTLGLLYSHLGRALELSIGCLAHQSGFGPKAVASRIKRVEFKGVKVSGGANEPDREGPVRRVVYWTVRDGSEAKLYSDCRKLAKYATAEVWETRFEALVQIIQLVTAEPRLRAFFNTPPTLLDLKNVTRSLCISSHGSAPREDELIKHKRAVYCATQALLAIEDSPLNDIVEEFLQMSFMHEDSQLLELSKYEHIITELLEYCRDPRYSFMAKALKPRALECANNVVVSLRTRLEKVVYLHEMNLDETIELHRTADVDEAIEYHRASLQLLPGSHPNRSLHLIDLATSLRTRFEQYGQTADIDEAIEHHRASLQQLLPDGHLGRPWFLNELAISLRTRFERHGQIVDIDEAIEHHCTTLQHLTNDPPKHSWCLDGLASSLRIRFKQHGQTADIDQATEHHCTVLQRLSNIYYHEHSWCLNELVISLRTRFKQCGQVANLNEAIEHYCAALQFLTDGHPDRFQSLVSLATSLRTRFDLHGQTADIDEAIEHHRVTLQIVPNGHPIRPLCLTDLAVSLETRSETYQVYVDSIEAVVYDDSTEAAVQFHAALQLLDEGYPNSFLSLVLVSLAISLQILFSQHGQAADIDEAVEHHCTALQLLPKGHPERSWCLDKLVVSL